MTQLRQTVLEDAARLISGDRDRIYGDAHENFRRIAAGWSEIFGTKIEPHQIALAMDWLKTCRLINKPQHLDSWTDKAGYTALGAEVAERNLDR